MLMSPMFLLRHYVMLSKFVTQNIDINFYLHLRDFAYMSLCRKSNQA